MQTQKCIDVSSSYYAGGKHKGQKSDLNHVKLLNDNWYQTRASTEMYIFWNSLRPSERMYASVI